MTTRPSPVMPADQQDALRAAHAAYRDAIDPHSPWANARWSTAVTAALAAGWSARAIADGLGIERKRVPAIAACAPATTLTVTGPGQGTFPAAAVRAFRKAEDAVNRRRLDAERDWVAAVRAARAAGWSCAALGALVGVSGERIRGVAALGLEPGPSPVPVFDPPARARPAEPDPGPPALSPEEAARMKDLAERARTARRTGASRPDPDRMAARRASEELTGLLVAAAGRGISWAALDRACGYARGGARARAARHGHGPAWASVIPYRRSNDNDYAAAGLQPPARKEA